MIETQNLIHHLFIIDEAVEHTASKELIHQVNQSIHAIRREAIRNQKQDHRITLYITSNRGLRCLYASTAAIIAPLIHLENFNQLPRKSNIYDAIGVGIGTLKVAEYRAKQAVRNQVTIFSCAVDTASQKYTSCNLKSLISMLQGQNWVFSFVGFSSDAQDLAKKIGIEICCIYRCRSQASNQDSILGIMKRQWIRRNPELMNNNQEASSQIEAA